MSDGAAAIGFACRDGTTRLRHLYQREPLRALFPAPETGELPLGVLVTVSGGLVAGDTLDIAVTLDPGTAAHVTAAAAEKIYRSPRLDHSSGRTTRIAQHLDIGAGAWLEYLPPETIVFDGARLRRRTRVALAAGAGFLGGDILVFGRRAHGERLTYGLLREVWEVARDGTLAWGDALHLDGDLAAAIDHPAGFAGAAACATLILAPPDGEPQRFLADARAVQVQSGVAGLRAGVTAIGGLVVARWLAAEAAPLRRAYADLACHFRAAAMGLPPRLPRLWHV